MPRESDPVVLSWPGRAPRRPLPAADLVVTHAGEADVRLVHGDNLAAMSALAEELRGAVALAYFDPPFLTGRAHERIIRARDEDGRPSRRSLPAFDDRWSGLAEYLDELGARMAAARALLAPEGCLVVHVDPRTSHYVRVLGDEIFGVQAFASEIVWRYRRWPAKTRNFQRVHDTLLRWVRDPQVVPRFHQLYEPLAPSTLATWGARRQRAVVDERGRRARSSVTEAATPGAPLGDVWEIGIVAPVARERTGWPTQKPEALLERLLLACTAPGDVVIDPYAGSGTTLAVAARLGRRAIGVDQSADAIALAAARLLEAGRAPARHAATIRVAPRSARRKGPGRAPRAA
ncbi:MAG: site-specific DNA-methyltransferase [Polyangiaceae bacterium]|nr:site-specific DNA-methyltransferase [Polyangiaceae bacterium]